MTCQEEARLGTAGGGADAPPELMSGKQAGYTGARRVRENIINQTDLLATNLKDKNVHASSHSITGADKQINSQKVEQQTNKAILSI